ncbi:MULTISPECIES: VOC family protein [Idiomarina]|uniref:VOC family protein n=1 Tax=Idiomarina TaxID=135575 RepID=UPI00129CACF3|nr:MULTISPECIES: VOC family protein [Idiomarina]MRJ42848.1 glyoxalase [Idiomarina sp. FeN1]NCU58398.1 glyoxalase [Idiomarina sp. FenA--70]NCU61096.1 glyoxalase [Idiomarina sp. FenBw--71]UUN13053.1 VOC family protein [Idiomarina loihiensis]
MQLQPFHLAIPVSSIEQARAFYGNVLGLAEGRSAAQWVDWDFFGHQLVTHLAPERAGVAHHNPVDGHEVPVPHFGVVLTMPQWQQLAEQVTAAGIKFVIEPHIRFAGQPGEQATMFFYDYCGNALEFKAFQDLDLLFAR